MSDAAFEIAARGMAAERSAMDVIAQRLASGGSADAVHAATAASDRAFVPASFSSALDEALAASGSMDEDLPVDDGPQWASMTLPAEPAPLVDIAHVDRSASSPRSDGDPIGQMIALVAAGRAYDADVAALQAAKQMDVEASDIDKF
ncbi:MAG TPA: hypothetical protein VJN22_07365 [Candidatus Eremiobacteraceae bacterium]|nr:hypothetical protein [Candidatus Eremiobacteraceae bacterium]